MYMKILKKSSQEVKKEDAHGGSINWICSFKDREDKYLKLQIFCCFIKIDFKKFY